MVKCHEVLPSICRVFKTVLPVVQTRLQKGVLPDLTDAIIHSLAFDELLNRDAPDSGFCYPAGYRIGRVVKNYPAG